MRRVFYIIILALLPLAGSAQSIADLARKAEIEKNPLRMYSIIGNCNNGLYIVRKDVSEDKETSGPYVDGVADDDGTVYVSVEYDQIEFATKGSEYKDNVYKCEKDGKWGLVSSVNGTLLPCEYRSLINYGKGIWRISTSGRCGYAKLNGTSSATTLIPCIYESLGHYSSSSLIHATFQGKKGMIDGQNNIVIPFEYSTVSDLCHAGNGNGIVWVEKNGKHGIYNDKGQMVQSCDIDKAYTLTESNSAMELSYTNCPPDDYIYIVRNGLTGLMSGSTYETLVPCMYEYLSPIKAGKAFYKANGKWGIIDTANKTIQLAIYSNVEIGGSSLSEQNMPSKAFQSDMYVRNNGKVGMLKAGGEDFIPVRYDSLGVYYDSMLVAKAGGKYGFLNADGREAVPFIYSRAYDYSEGLAAVVNEKGKYLFIDKSVNVAIKPKEYDRVGKFTNGTCRVFRKDKVWEIDREGKKVKDSKKKVGDDNVDEDNRTDDMYVGKTEDVSKYDSHLRNFSDGLLPFAKNKKLEYYDIGRTENVSGNYSDTSSASKYTNTASASRSKTSSGITMEIPAESQIVKITPEFINKIKQYSVVDIFSEGMAAVCRDDSLWGYIDTEGNEVIPCMYNRHVGCFSEGIACVPSNDQDGIKFINRNNETIIDNSYVYDKNLQSQLAYYWLDDYPCRLPCFVNGITKVMRAKPDWGRDIIYVDTKGNEMLSCEESSYNDLFDRCNPLETVSKLTPLKNEETVGMKDNDGKIIIPPIYTAITYFRNGVALFLAIRGEPHLVWSTGDESMCVVKWGYVDEKGNTTLSQKDIYELKQCEQKVKAFREKNRR